jgi:hypothetical protein
MKKTIISLAIGLVVTQSYATDLTGGTVAGYVNSGVNGVTSSYSTVNGVNGSAWHVAGATAQNSTLVGGASLPGTTGARSGTLAVTQGSTTTFAMGSGGGFSYGGAEQVGHGKIDTTALVNCNGLVGQVGTGSEVGTSTWSTASVVNTGTAFSGTDAISGNVSFASVNGSTMEHGVMSDASGKIAGVDHVRTFGSSTGDSSINAGAMTGQGGYFNGNVTNTFSATVTAPKCETGCGNTPTNGSTGHANNGHGNGDQDAPGNSSSHNNAENSDHSGQGNSSGGKGKGRK